MRPDCTVGRSVAQFLVITCQSSVVSCIYYQILWQQGREPAFSFFLECHATWQTDNMRGLSTETEDHWRPFFHFKERMAFTDFLSLIAAAKESRNRGNAASNHHQSLLRQSRAFQALLLYRNLRVNNFDRGAQFIHSPFELAGPLSLFALVGHCCYLGQVWSSETGYWWKWSKVEADRGNEEWWIAACVAGNRNNTKSGKTYLVAIVLSWTFVQRTEPNMAKLLRRFSSFCQFVHKSKIIFMILKRWDALEVCLLNFGSFTFLQLKKVSFRRSTEGAGRKLELVARYEGINKIHFPCILSIRHLLLLFVCLLCSGIFLFLPLKEMIIL